MTGLYVALGIFLALVAFMAWAVVRVGAMVEQREEAERRAEEAEAYAKTRKQIDEADVVGDDPAAARRWLRERAAQQQRDL